MKRLSWLLVICLSVFLMSCSSNTPEDNPVADPASSTPETQESQPVKTNEPTELTDKDLIDSLNGEMPSAYIMEMSSTFQDELSMTIRTTIMDGYSKIETSNTMMPKAMVMIYNPIEKIMYQYAEGDTFGMKFADVDTDMGNMFDMEDSNYSNMDVDDFESEFGPNYTAKRQRYKDQDVIYIESKVDSEEGMGQLKMWFSEDFYIPLKYELYVDNTLVMSSEVTHFDATPSLSPKDFEPPENIQFQELDGEMMDFNN